MRLLWKSYVLAGMLALLVGVGVPRLEGVNSSASTARSAGGLFYTTTITIPTYPYTTCLSSAYDPLYNITYPKLDGNSYNPWGKVPVAYELLVLENDYLLVTLLPQLGGRVYRMIYKPTGHNELYQNPVIKPTHWGPPQQGWWLAAGGLEWCLPVDEHGYEWGQPWSWSAITSTAGVTVTLRDTLASDRIRAAIPGGGQASAPRVAAGGDARMGALSGWLKKERRGSSHAAPALCITPHRLLDSDRDRPQQLDELAVGELDC